MHVHFVAVKIGVIRLCHRHIEPERALLHDFRYMTHHRTPMEGRLSVKQHCVSVHHVSMNHVAVFQINGVSVDVSQRDINAVSAFQYFSTRKVSGPFFISIAENHGSCH
jgi:hypothetical protein